MLKSTGIKLVLMSLLIVALLAGGGCFNKPPTITSLTPSATEVTRGGSCTISCVASDPDGDALTYSWSATGGSISGNGSSVTWTAPDAVGTYSVTVTVSDGEETVSESCNIQVVNSPPVIASLTPSATELAPSDSCTVDCVASDPDGDTLSYEWAVSGGAIAGSGSNVTWEAPAAEGTYNVRVTVSDGQGGTDSAQCDITVEMKFGSIDIKSNPAGASVFINGVDTGNITPYVITNLTPGTYTVELRAYHYKYRQQAVIVNPNDTTYINWSLDYAPDITLTMQPIQDSYVYDPIPDANYGNDDFLYAGARAMGICRSYLQFNVDLIPENAVILSARVGLYYFYNAPGTSVQIGAYPVLGAWTETGVTWNNQPTCSSSVQDTHLLPATISNNFHYWYITDLVTGWWNGSVPNLGVVLQSTNEPGWEGWVGFYSSERSTTAQRPKLVITYFDPTS
jgi:hypothetical protein